MSWRYGAATAKMLITDPDTAPAGSEITELTPEQARAFILKYGTGTLVK